MSISSTLDRLHARAKQNSWLWLFSIFCRVSLAFGFIPPGMVKIMDERFASGLHANHPMGHYLVALFQTGYYYTFIGFAQVAAAIILLIPRTVTLGAFIYFPIIFNILILTFATRFEGSLFTAPLMTLANLYLLGWNYEKWKYILPFNHLENEKSVETIFKIVAGSFFSRYRHRLALRAFPQSSRTAFYAQISVSQKFPVSFRRRSFRFAHPLCHCHSEPFQPQTAQHSETMSEDNLRTAIKKSPETTSATASTKTANRSTNV